MAEMSSGVPFSYYDGTPARYNHSWGEFSSASISPSGPLPSESTTLCSHYLSPRTPPGPGTFSEHSHSNIQSFPHFQWERSGCSIPVASASGQDSRAFARLDIGRWSPSPSPFRRSAMAGLYFPLTDIRSEILDISDGSQDSASHDALPVTDTGPVFQIAVTPNTQPVECSGSFSSVMYSHGNTLNHRPFQLGVPQVSPLWRSCVNSAKDTVDQWQIPAALANPPTKRKSSHGHSKHACTINFEGLQIDKDDLLHGANQGSGLISVHQCLWDLANDPCNMWIVGSRSRVGNHIRRWHSRERHAGHKTKCLWEGCSQMMLKDSVNRHIVTAHIGERFHCRGCHEDFPRQDVYNLHVGESEGCRSAGLALIYGFACRLIDTRQVLHREGIIPHTPRFVCL